MKHYKLFAGIVFLLLVASTSSTLAYTPNDEGFVQVNVYAMTEDRENVIIGNPVEFSIVVRNLWNDTISNITITQAFEDPNIDIISVAQQDITGNQANLEDLTVTDDNSGNELQITYLNVSESDDGTNITTNIDITLEEDQFFALDFTLNFTTDGDYGIDQPTVTYYDHWGDLHSEIQGQGTQVTVDEESEDTRTQYIPSFDTDEPNYTYLVGGVLAIMVVALLGRLLHFKKPFEI